MSKAMSIVGCLEVSRRMSFQSPVTWSIRVRFLLPRKRRKDESISSSFLTFISLSVIERSKNPSMKTKTIQDLTAAK